MTNEYQRQMARSMTEDELLSAIIEAAGLMGWRVHHDRGKLNQGRTQGHPGFPDLVLARRGRVLFLELKSEAGRQTEDQLRWALELVQDRAALAHFQLVRPADLDSVLEQLR